MAKTDINKLEEFEDTLTDEERQALSDGDDFEIDGEFDDLDVKLATETMRERLEREAAESNPDAAEKLPDAADDLEKIKADDDADVADGEEGEDGEDGEDGDAKQPAPAAEAPKEEGAAPDAAAEEIDKPTDAAPVTPQVAPQDTARLYDAAMEKVDKDIEAKIGDLSTKLEDMDITPEEFRAKVAEINASRRGLISSTVAEAVFDDTVSRYLGANPSIATEAHIAGLNAVFSSIDGNPLYSGLSDYDKLGKAHEIYHSQVEDARARGLNIAEIAPPASKAAPKKADAAPAAETPAKTEPAKAPKVNTPPKTLRQAPASETAGDGSDGKASTIQKLLNSKDPDAIEKALMSGTITNADLEALG